MDQETDLLELSGTVEAVIYKNEENGYTVLRLRDGSGENVTVVGCFPYAAAGESMIVSGQWMTHSVHGRQFKAEFAQEKGIRNPACLVDCNHANSGKQYLEQIRIAKEVLHSKRHSGDIDRLVKGLMIESYIEDGNQKITECTYGRSITDPCLGWEKTQRLVLELAELL